MLWPRGNVRWTTAFVRSLKERSRVHCPDGVTSDNRNGVAVFRENHPLGFQKGSDRASTTSVQRTYDNVGLGKQTYVCGKMMCFEEMWVRERRDSDETVEISELDTSGGDGTLECLLHEFSRCEIGTLGERSQTIATYSCRVREA